MSLTAKIYVWVLLAALVTVGAANGLNPQNTPPPAPAAPGNPDVALTPAQFWTPAFGTSPRIPMAGDGNGDGRADLLSLWPQGDGVIDAALTSYFGKPVAGNQARTRFGKDGIAAACGPFARQGSVADILAVFADGTVRIASDMAVGSRSYAKDELAGTIPVALIPKPPVRAVMADFDVDDKADVVLLGKDGRLLLLLNRRTADGKPAIVPIAVKTPLVDTKQIAAGQFEAGKPAELVWLSAKGALSRADLKITCDTSAAVSAPQVILETISETKLAVGRFCGAKTSDILIGQRLLPGGKIGARPIVLSSLPTVEEARGDAPWIAADFDGNGRDDLLRLRRTGERFIGEDTFIHFSYGAQDSDKGYFSTAGDGLPDVWKTGKIKPGGMDLAALGCQVGRKEAIVEIERFENVSLPNLRTNLQRVAQFYAVLPVRNPDGSTGITLHFIYKDPTPLRDHDQVMREFDQRFPPPAHRGVVHTMFAENNGPLVSKVKGDNGHFNGDAAVFIHEFGHQIDLSHEGFHQVAFSAVYPSVMNYSYSYSVNGRREDIRYSGGLLADLSLKELHLSEVLPAPLSQVQFLSGPPYNFHLRAAPGGQKTLVDWNWNGVFGETDVQADINYSHGITIGPRYDLGRSQTAPVLVTQRTQSTGSEPGERLLMLYGKSTAGRTGSLSPTSPGQLVLRVWRGADPANDKAARDWSDEIPVAENGTTGDPTAVSLGGITWAAYPTSSGVAIRFIRLPASGDKPPQIGPPLVIQNSYNAQPALTTIGNRLALLLWRDSTTPVGLRFLDFSDGQLLPRPESSLGFRSAVAVGAVAAGPESVSVGRIACTDETGAGKTEVIRLTSDGGGRLQTVHREWVDGVYSSHRMTLLWRAENGFGETGRLFQLSGGVTSGSKPAAEQYLTQQVAYPEIGNGWQWRKYYQDDYASQSAPGACWYQNNIVYALRLYNGDPNRNDVISFGFYGTGASPETQGDFDDIRHLSEYGLSRSIPILPQ